MKSIKCITLCFAILIGLSLSITRKIKKTKKKTTEDESADTTPNSATITPPANLSNVDLNKSDQNSSTNNKDPQKDAPPQDIQCTDKKGNQLLEKLVQVIKKISDPVEIGRIHNCLSGFTKGDDKAVTQGSSTLLQFCNTMKSALQNKSFTMDSVSSIISQAPEVKVTAGGSVNSDPKQEAQDAQSNESMCPKILGLAKILDSEDEIYKTIKEILGGDGAMNNDCKEIMNIASNPLMRTQIDPKTFTKLNLKSVEEAKNNPDIAKGDSPTGQDADPKKEGASNSNTSGSSSTGSNIGTSNNNSSSGANGASGTDGANPTNTSNPTNVQSPQLNNSPFKR